MNKHTIVAEEPKEKPRTHKQILKSLHEDGKYSVQAGKEMMIRGHAKMMGAKMMMGKKSMVKEPKMGNEPASMKLGF